MAVKTKFGKDKIMKRSITFLIASFCASCMCYCQSKPSAFKDSLDNAFDVSTYLLENNGILPFLIPITEPAVGFGVIVGGAYFVNKKDPLAKKDVAALVGGLTTNGTWMAGGAYLGFWNEDRIRYRGIAGYGDISLEYYRDTGTPIDFELNQFTLSQQMLFRLGDSDVFLGGKYQLSKINIPAFQNIDIIDAQDLDLWNSGISLITEFDSTNNTFSPTDGLKIQLSYDQYLEFLGSTKNWNRLNFFAFCYFPVNEKWIPAFRIETSWASVSAPFYAKPYVALRGIPALRYQGEGMILAETEQLYNITKRWGILAFAGAGSAYTSGENSGFNETVWNFGAGFRYLIARKLGLKTGLDIAKGPEEWAFYITIGTSWLR